MIHGQKTTNSLTRKEPEDNDFEVETELKMAILS
jgi:hypothetical protein